MAELPPELKDVFDEFIKASKKNKDALDESATVTSYLGDALKKLQEQAKKTDAVFKDVNRSTKQEKDTTTQLNQAARKFVNTYIEESKRITQARKDGDYTAAESKRLLELNESAFQNQMAMLGKSHTSYYSTIVPLTIGLQRFNNLLNNDVTRAIGGFTKSILTAATSSATGLEARISIANTTFDLGIKLFQSVAGAIPIIGDAARELIGKVGEAGKTLLDFFGKETVKLASSLKNSASAGFVFADGLTGLRSAATNAGLTTDLFTKAIIENREAVMQFGGNLTEGANRIGRVTRELGTTGVDRLQQFGYSLDEVPGLIAEVGARMRRSGSVTDAEVAKQTLAYAQNLKLIAELTGQDAKTLQAKRDANERDLAFQQFLADKTPAEAEAIRRQMELLPSAAQDLFKEMAQTGGQIFSESGNILAQQAPAIAEMARRLFSAAETGGITKDTSIEILKDLGTTAKEQISSVRDFARAAAVLPEYQEVGQKLAESFKTLSAIDFTKIDQLIADLDKAGREDPTSKLLREEERKGMSEMVGIQNLVNEELSRYLTIVRALNTPVEMLSQGLTALANGIRGIQEQQQTQRALSNNISTAEQQAEVDRLTRRLSQASTGAITSQIEGALSDSQRTLMQNNPNLPNPVTNREAFLRSSAAQGDEESRAELLMMGIDLSQGQALGGILSGPKSGYLAKLHGTEAVLPENLTDLLTNAATSAQTLKEQLPMVTNMRNTSEELLADISAKFDNMIELLNNISGHTETTAARVA